MIKNKKKKEKIKEKVGTIAGALFAVALNNFMTLSLEIGGAPTHSRFSRSYFKITPMDGCLLIGLPHFPPRKNKLPHSLCQGVQIEKSTRQREGERESKKKINSITSIELLRVCAGA